MKNLVSRFLKDESGATAIEYGLIAAGIAIAIIAAVQGRRRAVSGTNFQGISTSFSRQAVNNPPRLQRPRQNRGLCCYGWSRRVRHA